MDSHAYKSTAPEDQPRNGTTVTLYLPNAETISESDLIAHLESEPRRTGPRMTGVQIHLIHNRKPAYGDVRGPSICCLISWQNPSYVAPSEGDGGRGPLAYNQPSLSLGDPS